MQLEAIFEKSLKEWSRNLYCSVPLIIESLAIMGFVHVLTLAGFSQIIDQSTIETAMNLAPFIVSSFLMLVLLSSFLEAAGLGAIKASLDGKRKGIWSYGNALWLKMFEITIATISLYLLFSMPALILLYMFPMSLLGFFVMFGVVVLLSVLLFLSKYVLVVSRRSVWYSIKRSVLLVFRSPAKVLKIMLVIMIINLPVLFLSSMFPVLGAFLVGFFTQTWSSFFIFMAYGDL